MSNARFVAIVGAAIVVLIGILLYQKILQCEATGGVACCFGRMCSQIAKPPAKGVDDQP